MASILNNCAFIHIPRTGSTFVRVALKECGIPHSNSGYPNHSANTIHHTLREAWPEISEKKYIFSFVRNPITYLQSMWIKRPIFFMNMLQFDYNQCENFQQFSAAYVSSGRPCVGTLFDKFLYIEEHYQKNIIKATGTLENIREILIKFLKIAGEKFDENIIINLEAMHIGARKMEQCLKYPREVLEIFIDLEKETLRKYGYSEEVNDYAKYTII